MGSKLRLGGVIVDEPGLMRDGHASRGDIDDNSAMGALAIFPATMMVADGVFGEGGQGVLKRQRGAANISAIVDGVMVAQHRWQFADDITAIRSDITHHALIAAAIVGDVDACDAMLLAEGQDRGLAARFTRSLSEWTSTGSSEERRVVKRCGSTSGSGG